MKKNTSKNPVEIDFRRMLEEGKLDATDVSLFFDLAHALMNIIEMEEHTTFSYVKTGDEKYAYLIPKLRLLRARLLNILNFKMRDGSEAWCLGKHLFSAWYRCYEVVEKLLQSGNLEIAEELRTIPLELLEIYVYLKSQESRDENVGREKTWGRCNTDDGQDNRISDETAGKT